jgi:hypothetical protein
LLNYDLNSLGIQLLNILLGFFAATALSTIPAQTGDWGIVAAAIIVTNQEIISKIIYKYKSLKPVRHNFFITIFLKYCNNIKIGILYGLFVDAFKLGS